MRPIAKLLGALSLLLVACGDAGGTSSSAGFGASCSVAQGCACNNCYDRCVCVTGDEASCVSACQGGSSGAGASGASGSGAAGSAGSGSGGSATGGASAGGSGVGGSGVGGSGGGSGAGGAGGGPAGAPPFGGSSLGSGGPAPVSGAVQQAGSIAYRLIVPASYRQSSPIGLLVVFSGVEGGQTMTQNLLQVGAMTGVDQMINAVLDGKQYFGNGQAGVAVLDDVRGRYNVDNDRTYLLSESAGTRAGLQLGFDLRQGFFAAFWANDVNAAAAPAQSAADLGFAPFGQAGPGGQLALATQIVQAMSSAGYRVATPAPYSGPGSTSHGDPNQFIAALGWFSGKTRR